MSLLNSDTVGLVQIVDKGKRKKPYIVCQVWYHTLNVKNRLVENIAVPFLYSHAREIEVRISMIKLRKSRC